MYGRYLCQVRYHSVPHATMVPGVDPHQGQGRSGQVRSGQAERIIIIISISSSAHASI